MVRKERKLNFKIASKVGEKNGLAQGSPACQIWSGFGTILVDPNRAVFLLEFLFQKLLKNPTLE